MQAVAFIGAARQENNPYGGEESDDDTRFLHISTLLRSR